MPAPAAGVPVADDTQLLDFLSELWAAAPWERHASGLFVRRIHISQIRKPEEIEGTTGVSLRQFLTKIRHDAHPEIKPMLAFVPQLPTHAS